MLERKWILRMKEVLGMKGVLRMKIQRDMGRLVSGRTIIDKGNF